MKRNIFVCCLALWSLVVFNCAAQGTRFTYQGRLSSGSAPFTGDAEFQPTLWNDLSAGSQVAANNPATVIVAVTNGLFVLPLDFGAAALGTGSDRWLQLQVRTTIGAFTTLAPRQQLTPAPYAIFSANAAAANTALSAASVSAANIIGQLGLAQLPPTVVTNTQSGLALAGTFSGDGGALTNLSPAALAFHSSGVSIVSWGWNDYNQRSIPAGLDDVVSVAAGTTHSLALRADGTVVAWGGGRTNDLTGGADSGQSIVPPGLNSVGAVSAGYLHSMALRSNGTVVAWGLNSSGQTNVPAGLNNVRAISAGLYHSLALRRDGTVAIWGTNSHGQLDIPPGLNDVKAVAAGYLHNLVLRSNGTVVVWGGNDYGASNVPPGLNNVVGIAAGATINLALRGDGTVAVWGTNSSGELDVPPGLSNVIAVAAGLQQGLVLKSDGTVVAWGYDVNGATNVPAGLNNVVSLGRGFGYHFLVLRRKSDAPVAWLDSDNTFNGSIEVNGDVRASGELLAAGGLRLNENNLWLRGGNDLKNALGWYGNTKTFGYGVPSGPVLFGEAGGALGTFGTNGQRVALKWDDRQRVTIGNDDFTTAPALVFSGAGYGMSATNSEFRFFLNGSGRFTFSDSFGGAQVMAIVPNGFGGGGVGLGTSNPNGRLDVRGDIRLGSAGQFYATAGEENLRIVRGVVNAAGSILNGTGFTVTKGPVGYFTINFTPSFSGTPAVTVTAQSGITRIATCTSVTSSAGGIWTRDAAGNAADNQFNFIAIGPR